MAKYDKPQQPSNYRLNYRSQPALVGLAIGLFIGFLLGQALLTMEMHPLHWVVAVRGGAVGYLIGLFYFLVRLA